MFIKIIQKNPQLPEVQAQEERVPEVPSGAMPVEEEQITEAPKERLTIILCPL
jgi:hypothetical protein